MLTDVIELTDSDIEALMNSEKPCEFGREIKEKAPHFSVCKDKADGVLIIRCPECGRRKAVIMCTPCRDYAWKFLKIVKIIGHFARNSTCRHKIRNFTITWVSF